MTPGDWVISEFLLLWYLSKMNHQATNVLVPEYRTCFSLFVCLFSFLVVGQNLQLILIKYLISLSAT